MNSEKNNCESHQMLSWSPRNSLKKKGTINMFYTKENFSRTAPSSRTGKSHAILALLAMLATSVSVPATTYRLSDSFSLTNNPNGPWAYGWAGSLGGSFTPITVRHTSGADAGATIPSWQLTSVQAPVVYQNISTNTISVGGGVASFNPGEMWFYPGENGRQENFGVIRFTAPATGQYQLQLAVSPVYPGSPQGDTDFHVLKNGVEVFGEFLSPTNSSSYATTLAASAGDTIDFAIGRGADGNAFGSGLRISGSLIFTPPAIDGSSFDLSRDFSSENNPSGAWSLGWKAGFSEPFNLLTVKHLSPAANGVVTPSWQLTSFQTPAVYHNPTTNTAVFGNNLGTLAPGGVIFYPGENGRPENFGVIRFTAPSNGSYIVNASVAPVYDGAPQGDTDFHVVKNGTELFGRFLAPADQAGYTDTLTLAAGDVVDFLIGRGNDGNQYGSGLKIKAVVAPVVNISPDGNLVVNGSFEEGVNPGISADVPAPDSATITGWTVEAASVDYIGSRWTAGDGARCLDLSGTDAGTISQIISGLTPGQAYRLSFLMAANPEVPPYTARLRAVIGDASGEFSFNQPGISTGNLGWTAQSLNFTASASTHKLSFISLNPGWAGAALDKVAIIQTTNPPVGVPAPPGLVGWWRGEGNAEDSAGSNDGSLQNGASISPGFVGQAFSYDGIDDTVRVPSNASLDIGAGEGATIELWINPVQIATQSTLLEWASTEGPEPGLHFWTSVFSPGSLFANLTDVNGVAHHFSSPGGILRTGTFQHVAFTYDRGSGIARFFVNGAQVAEQNMGSLRLDTRSDLWFGRRILGGGNQFLFNGQMDEISIYNRALAAEEIAAVFNAGSAGKLIPTPPIGNLVVNGSFEEGVNPGISTDVPAPNSATITGWTIEAASVDYIGSRWTAGDGARCLDLSGTDAGTISQIISGLTPGQAYRLSFLMAANPEVPPYTARLRVVIGDASGEFSFNQPGISTGNLGWAAKSLDFTASASTHKLSFISLNPGWAGAALDRVAIIQTTNPPTPASYNLSDSFNLDANPNGDWSYGYLTSLGGSFGLLARSRSFQADNGVPIGVWELGTFQLPIVGKVLGSGTAVSDGGRFTAPAGTIFFAPGADGASENYGVIRFTVPANAAGNYILATVVSSLFDSSRSRDADFHILKNGRELFGKFLGPNSSASFSNVIALAEGDTIDFAVGRGADGLALDTGLKIQASLTHTTIIPPPLNHPPVAKATLDPVFKLWSDETTLLVIAGNGDSAELNLDASQSSDPDGDALRFFWLEEGETEAFAEGVTATNTFEVGSHSVMLVADDGRASGQDILTVEVITLADAVDELILFLTETDMPRKDKRPLLATLTRVWDSFEEGRLPAGIKQLRAFQQKVRASLDNRPETARKLLSASEQIIEAATKAMDEDKKRRDRK